PVQRLLAEAGPLLLVELAGPLAPPGGGKGGAAGGVLAGGGARGGEQLRGGLEGAGVEARRGGVALLEALAQLRRVEVLPGVFRLALPLEDRRELLLQLHHPLARADPLG